MDPILEQTMFAGYTTREIVLAFAKEMRRRNELGVVYVFPARAVADRRLIPAVFASIGPSGMFANLTAAEQLAVFAEVARQTVNESSAILPADDGGWLQ